MSSTSSSAAPAAGILPEDNFHPLPLLLSSIDDSSPSSSSVPSNSSAQAFHFSSGNPRIEETRGVMQLFPDEGASSSPSPLPVGRKPLLCVLGVPNHMTYADFCQFCAAFIQHILEMRIVRNDSMEVRYSVLIRFVNQDSADSFYQYFRGRRFNSLELEVCHIRFIVDVLSTGYKGTTEHIQTSAAASSEQPSCPVCLEKLDQDTGGTLTTICNHTFHISCISKWTDSSCPVCRFCQQQAEKSICFECETSENLWICVICGFVGCGRYKGGHAISHWKETQHCYSLELETQRVWDYAGDNYVQRLIQSKTDGKLIALNSNDGCRSSNFEDSGMSEALLNSRVEAIVNEYNELLATQLERQKVYYEGLLQEIKEETEREISESMAKAIAKKLPKLEAKLEKCRKEKELLDELNLNLLKNIEIWESKVSEAEERERNSYKAKEDKIHELEDKLADLMLELDTCKQSVLPCLFEMIKDANSSTSDKGGS